MSCLLHFQQHAAIWVVVVVVVVVMVGGGGGSGVLESILAGYVPLASQSPFPIIVYSVANYRPHLSPFVEM